MRCVIYARLSVTADASVSVERQLESARRYAAARGWAVAAEHVDDGVSATRNRPEDRAGWRALLEQSEPYDVVIVWKVDRLARRVMDFLNADIALQARGAALVAVEDPIDLTTPTGRAFATMLAVFAEMEAAAVSARTAAARRHLLHAGRVAGGPVPYGWMSVRNPDGPGYVLTQDPDRIERVRAAVARVRLGESVYAAAGEVDLVYSSTERMLRNPILAGMISYNPGSRSKDRGPDVLRGADGLPVIYPDLAVMTPPEWRAMVRSLDERDSAQSQPRAMQTRTSALLSGLIWCRPCDRRMYRGTAQKRPGYVCPGCRLTVTNFEAIVVEEFLRHKGPQERWSVVREVHEAAILPEIEHRLAELTTEYAATDDDQEVERLTEQIAALRRLRREARAATPTVRMVPDREHVMLFREDWAAADGVVEQRTVLDDGLERVWVSRGLPGRATTAKVLSRLEFVWRGPDMTVRDWSGV